MWRAAYEQAKTFNKLDPRWAATLEGLAEALWHQGKLAEAEPLCKQILEIFKITRGPEHPDVGVTGTTWQCSTNRKASSKKQNHSTSKP